MGILDILRKNDAKRAAHGDATKRSVEREQHARIEFSEVVATKIFAALTEMRDPALQEITRLPIGSKQSEIGIFFECLGAVRLTLHCVVAADPNGVAYCSSIGLVMTRNNRTVRGAFEPMRGNAGIRTGKLGVPEQYFAVEVPKLKKAVESLANQL
jgi:hypothetical protein